MLLHKSVLEHETPDRYLERNLTCFNIQHTGDLLIDRSNILYRSGREEFDISGPGKKYILPKYNCW